MATEYQMEIVRLHEVEGLSLRDIARQMGKNKETIRTAYHRGKGDDIDPAVRAGMNHAGMKFAPEGGWIKTGKDENGTAYSFRFKVEQPGVSTEDIRDAFTDIRKAPKINPPGKVAEDIMTFLPVFDLHMGIAGKNYGVAEAAERVMDGLASIFGRLTPAKTMFLVNGGDWTHQNDPSNQTPRSKHPLDVDGRYTYIETIKAAVDLTAAMIDLSLKTHEHVHYAPLKGNHDPHTASHLLIGMQERYRGNDRVTIEAEDLVFIAKEWGNNLIILNHGDTRVKGADLLLAMASRYGGAWHKPVREFHTGHLHHLQVKEFPGVVHYQHRAVSPKSQHDHNSGYDAIAGLEAIQYHKKGGRHLVVPETILA